MVEALEWWDLAGRPHPFMAILNFFCDESGKYQKNNFVSVAGVGASAQRIAPFDVRWKELLRAYGIVELHTKDLLDVNRNVGTRMCVGQTLQERQELLFPFADCINEHLEIGLIQAWSVVGYNKLPLDVKRLIGGSPDPFYIAFVRGLLEIAKYVRTDDLVNVITDDNIVTAWDTYIHYREGLKADTNHRFDKFVGIAFAKSIHYSALQAADMVAFLTRRLANEQFNKVANDCKLLSDYLFTNPKPPKPGIMQWFQGIFGEQQMVNLANRIQDAKEKSVPDIRRDGEGIIESASRGDQTEAGHGKGTKEAEES